MVMSLLLRQTLHLEKVSAEDAVSPVFIRIVYWYGPVPLMQVKLQYYETASPFLQVGVV